MPVVLPLEAAVDTHLARRAGLHECLCLARVKVITVAITFLSFTFIQCIIINQSFFRCQLFRFLFRSFFPSPNYLIIIIQYSHGKYTLMRRTFYFNFNIFGCYREFLLIESQ